MVREGLQSFTLTKKNGVDHLFYFLCLPEFLLTFFALYRRRMNATTANTIKLSAHLNGVTREEGPPPSPEDGILR